MMAENTHHLNGEDFYRRNIFKTRRNKNDQAIITKKQVKLRLTMTSRRKMELSRV